MNSAEATRLLIAMATDLLGSQEAVRIAMAAEPGDFEAWAAGTAKPNRQRYDRLVKVVTALQQTQLEMQARTWANLSADFAKNRPT